LRFDGSLEGGDGRLELSDGRLQSIQYSSPKLLLKARNNASIGTVRSVLVLTVVISHAVPYSHLHQSSVLPHHVNVVLAVRPDVTIVQQRERKTYTVSSVDNGRAGIRDILAVPFHYRSTDAEMPILPMRNK